VKTLAEKLAQGLAELRLDLSAEQQIKLLDYLALMAKWNAVYNLTAIRDPQAMLVQHLLDSLAIVLELQRALAERGSLTPGPSDGTTSHSTRRQSRQVAGYPGGRGEQQIRLLDVGSGGGLPGIPVAIAMPQVQVTLIDPVHKKTAFLTQAKAAVRLDNLRVLTGKAEEVETEQRFDVITSRAFSSLAEFVQLAQHLLAPEGFFAAMKGVTPEEEISQLSAQSAPFHAYRVIPLRVPGLEAERCLVLIRKK